VGAVTVPVRRRGTITLPREVRRRYGRDEGDVFTLMDHEDGTLVVSPKASRVVQLADCAGNRVAEAGVGLDDLLHGLDEEREAYHRARRCALGYRPTRLGERLSGQTEPPSGESGTPSVLGQVAYRRTTLGSNPPASWHRSDELGLRRISSLNQLSLSKPAQGIAALDGRQRPPANAPAAHDLLSRGLAEPATSERVSLASGARPGTYWAGEPPTRAAYGHFSLGLDRVPDGRASTRETRHHRFSCTT
jgi:bifunctional DNA-binding transcriptional regulator/antitoxin component of YhaV-PrlF toxin-antitoxin module